MNQCCRPIALQITLCLSGPCLLALSPPTAQSRIHRAVRRTWLALFLAWTVRRTWLSIYDLITSSPRRFTDSPHRLIAYQSCSSELMHGWIAGQAACYRQEVCPCLEGHHHVYVAVLLAASARYAWAWPAAAAVAFLGLRHGAGASRPSAWWYAAATPHVCV